MTTEFSAARLRLTQGPFATRVLAFCLASLMLHLLAVNWVSANMNMPVLPQEHDRVITAELHLASAPPAEPVPAPPPEPAPPKPKAKPRHHPALRAKSAVTPATPADSASTALTVVAPPDSQPDKPAKEDGNRIEASPGISTETPPPDTARLEPKPAPGSAPAGVHYKVTPPPSGEILYDVEKVPHEGNPMYGHGKISWESSGGRYVINGEAGVFFITALTFTSKGTIDDFGVSPELYSEKRFRKSATNTHFHRERNTISFSASEVSYPRQGGEQDRASIIWQLAGIGRGDREKFAPDAELEIFVAGVRDGEIWHIHVIGQEDIDVSHGKMSAWHVVRAPRPGSYDQKLDIWLAPQHEWYPVKLRYTETNGDYLDMSLSSIHIALAPK